MLRKIDRIIFFQNVSAVFRFVLTIIEDYFLDQQFSYMTYHNICGGENIVIAVFPRVRHDVLKYLVNVNDSGICVFDLGSGGADFFQAFNSDSGGVPIAICDSGFVIPRL